MIISLLETFSAKVLDQSDLTWAEIKQLLSKHEHHPIRHGESSADAKKRIPLFAPSSFAPGADKRKENVLKVYLGVIDCDDVTKEQFEKTKAKLALTNYICYTTWSHTKAKEQQGSYRVRFVFPFTRPVDSKLWQKAWQKLNVFFEGALDPSCKDPSRGYFMPAGENLSDHWVKTNVGLDFDIEKLLMTNDRELKGSKVTSEDLKRLSAKLAKRKTEYGDRMSEVLNKALDGQAFAQQGERDTRIFEAAIVIAEEFPDCDPEQVVDLFYKSLETMKDAGSRKANRDNFISKLVRAKESVEAKKQEKQEAVEDSIRERIRVAFGGDNPRDYPYTPEELASFAAEGKCSVEQFKQRWVIQNQTDYHIFFNGKYWGPFHRDAAALSFAQRVLAPAYSAGVVTYKEGAKGNLIPKTMVELVSEYGTPVVHLEGSLVAQSSFYDDQRKVLVEATCPLRVTEAEYDPIVAEYLRLLGGTSAERLLDFISVVTLVDKPCAALYLHSPPGYGKSTLIAGLSRLWTTTGPTRLELALTQFNNAIAKCPLIFADENMPAGFRKNGNSGEWREFIQCETRPVQRKYGQPVDLKGCVRLIMAANNKEMLGTSEELSRHDIEAIIERVCYIDCDNPEVRVFLEKLPDGVVRGFVSEDRLAKHALWLRDNHAIKEKSRFLLSARNTSFHRAMVVGQGLSASISHWLISYLQQPNLIDMNINNAGHFRIKDGELYITTKGISDNWDTYNTHTNPPSPAKISKALTRISKGEASQQGKFKDKILNYWHIDKEGLITWAQENSYATRQEIETALSKDTREDQKAAVLLKEIIGAVA